MFKYTRASIDLIIRDIKKYYRIFRFISFIVMLSYFVFAAITGLGVLWVNIALASLLVVYEVTSQFITSKKTKKYLRRSYNWLKFIVRAVSLGFIIYGIYEAAEKASPLTIILATLMIIFWITQVTFEILLEIFEDKRDLFLEAVKADFDLYKEKYEKPINTVKSVVNFFSGKSNEKTPIEDVKDEKESKNLLRLKKHIEKNEEK